jgi:hypothetical protein
MSRQTGSSRMQVSYPCGKVTMMAERDSTKYKQLHFKVCDICKESTFSETIFSTRLVGTNLGTSKHGNIVKPIKFIEK